ncbi:hypothetical protein H4582DRAFT_2082077 [Lactarius indigo]|nr:hypothetical protein H4582DRAFT_2082077 [Lactarius indigo]
MAIECQTSNPICLPSGAWSWEVTKTGNYIYTLIRKVPMECILTFSKLLCQPFPRSMLVPSDGWCWAQLCNVVIANQDGFFHDEDALYNKLTCNPCFENIQIIQRPYWINDLTKIKLATSMVVFTYINPIKSITMQAIEVAKIIDPAPALPTGPHAILKQLMEVDMRLPPARVDDTPDVRPPANVNLFNDEALAALASAPS